MSKDQPKKTTKLHTILVHKVQLHPWLLNQLEVVDPQDQSLDTVALPESIIASCALHHALRETLHRKKCDYRQATHCGD